MCYLYLYAHDNQVGLERKETLEIALAERALGIEAVSAQDADVDEDRIRLHGRERCVAHEVARVGLVRSDLRETRVQLDVHNAQHLVEALLNLR